MNAELLIWIRIREIGNHNCCYWRNGNEKYYFDSFGLIPPKEVIKYLKTPIMYSAYQIQQFNDSNCSKKSLFVLDKLNKGNDYIIVLYKINR